MSGTWTWISLDVVFAIHDRQIAEHGGLAGLRDRGALEAALARPRNLAEYGTPDAASLAAAYAFGLTRNHGFVDGNKRMSWILSRLFLADNGFQIKVDMIEAIEAMQQLSAGSWSEETLAHWFRARITSL